MKIMKRRGVDRIIDGGDEKKEREVCKVSRPPRPLSPQPLLASNKQQVPTATATATATPYSVLVWSLFFAKLTRFNYRRIPQAPAQA